MIKSQREHSNCSQLLHLTKEWISKYHSSQSSGTHQDTLLQNMAPLHSDYFKLKEFEETTEEGRSLCPSLCPFPLKWATKCSVRGALPVPRGKEHPCLWRKRDPGKNPSRRRRSPSSLPLPHTPSLTIFLHTVHSSPGLVQNIQACFCGTSSPYEGSHVMENLHEINLYVLSY